MVKKATLLPAPDRDDTIEYYETDLEDEEIELTSAEKAERAAIDDLNNGAKKGVRIRVFRQTGSGKESMERICSYPIDKFTIDELIDKIHVEYGGGDFRFQISNNKGKMVTNTLMTLATKIMPDKMTGEGGAFGVLNSVLEKQERMTQLLFDRNNGGETSRIDFMKEMIMMKEIFSGGESAQPKSAMGQMKEMMEVMVMMKESANPEPKEESNSFTKIFSDSIPLLAAIAQGSTNRHQNQQPINNHQNTTRKTRQRKPQQENKEIMMKKMAVNQLLEYCKNGNQPDMVAQELSEKIPDIYIPQIESLILAENPVDEIIKINSEVSNHREWFINVVEWLKGYLGHPSKFSSEFQDDDEIEEGLNQEKSDNDNGVNSQDLRDGANETIIVADGETK